MPVYTPPPVTPSLGIPLGRESNFQTQEIHSHQQLDSNQVNDGNDTSSIQKQINTNANPYITRWIESFIFR